MACTPKLDGLAGLLPAQSCRSPVVGHSALQPVRPDFRCDREIPAQVNSQFAGQTGLMQVQLLLTQHSFAFAASLSLHCSLGRGSGHSMVPITVNFKPTLRRIMFDNHTSPDNATFAVGVLRPIRHDLVQAATSRRLQGFRFKAPIP